MSDLKNRIQFSGTVKDLKEVLNNYDENSIVHVSGMNTFYIHESKGLESNFILFDESDLEEEYDE